MAPAQDACDFLAGEVLSEMAGNFFGRRRALENLIELVSELAAALRPKAAAVDRHAGLLNRLLLDPQSAAAFYAAIGIPAPGALAAAGFDPEALPDRIPAALVPAQRFKKLVRRAYAALQKACDEYLYGPPEPRPDPEQACGLPPSYHLVLQLAEKANAEVDRINREVSPSAVLQSARRFGSIGPYRRQVEDVCPQMAGGDFDRKFAFARVDIPSLGLEACPELPAPVSVEPQLSRFCDRFYSARRDAVRTMMDGLGAEIRRR